MKSPRSRERVKREKAAGSQSEPLRLSVAAHPRAGRGVRRAKGWAGLAGFAIAAYLSAHAGVPSYIVGLRALAAGAAGYLLGWAVSVTVWRHLVVAELRTAVERATAAAEEAE